MQKLNKRAKIVWKFLSGLDLCPKIDMRVFQIDPFYFAGKIEQGIRIDVLGVTNFENTIRF